MNTVDIIAEILKREGIEVLSCFPTTPIIESAAKAGIRPIICRQERVGVGIADGYSRITNGDPLGVFAMQYGPGAENAYSGIATAYSDSTPLLLLPMGHPTDRQRVYPLYNAMDSFATVNKQIEQITSSDSTDDVFRRAFSALRTGRGGPVTVELPINIASHDVSEESFHWPSNLKPTVSQGDPADIQAAARALCSAKYPVIHAGQGVLYAGATPELVELSELLGAPVMTTLLGKSAFPEVHPLALGTGSGVMPGPVYHFVRRSDVIFGIGCSFTKHGMSMNLPEGKTLIHSSNDPRDINKDYEVEYPIVGDAKLVLRQMIDACIDLVGPKGELSAREDFYNQNAREIKSEYDGWVGQWQHKLTDRMRPINPYAVIAGFMQAVPPSEAIVTHDSGSPRDQITPFYKSNGPRTYIGWGKSHGLGTGLGLIIGAKIADPDKVCVNFMGDAAFGMVGLDFETAVRSSVPIITVVLNNSTMAVETTQMADSHQLYRTRDLGGNYADMATAMGGYAERIEDPNDIVGAFQRARIKTEEGTAVLLEFITSAETDYSIKRPF